MSKSGSGAGSIPLNGLASLVYTNAQSQTVSNRITTAGYEYDPAGNQTRGQTENGTWRRYKYDSAGRLAVALDDSSNPQETYSYGASNERLLTVYGNGLGAPATYYCWEGGQVIADFRAGTSSNLVWEKSYVYLGGRLLATADINGTKYHHPDRLGTRLITDTSGNVTTEQVNLPYGTALTTESSGAISNRRFTSYDRSATTGMDYAVNRFYNSAQGRFTQVDPIGMAAASLEDPQTLNLYGYCGNDPVNHVDPDGLFFGKFFRWIGKAIKAVAKVFAVVLAVAAVLAFSWGFVAIGVVALIGSGIYAAIGWGNGRLSEFAGAFLGTQGKGGNFRTPPINGGVGVSGINSFLQQRERARRQPTWDEALGKKIANIAKKNIGETAWETTRDRKGRDGKLHKAGTYKCSTFVFDVLKAAGAPAPTSGGQGEWNATAGEWGNPNVDTIGGRWKIVRDGSLKPGDVIANRFTDVGRGAAATGHVAIIGPDLETIGTGIPGGIITSTNWGTGRSTDGVVVRRCTK